MNPQWSSQQPQQPQRYPQMQMQQPMMTGYPAGAALRPQQTGYPGAAMMGQQPTGYPGQSQGLQQPQPQQMQLGSFNAVPSTFVSTFMPSNPNANWSSQPQFGGNPMAMMQQQQQPMQAQPTGMPQYQQQQQQQQAPAPLPQYFAQHNQQFSGQSAVQVQWALTADERRKYDQIFRAWDMGTGYITGQRALEVFKESGLDRNDLMKIWALADRENRGKLNLAEFHVSMGLIYRKLSGNPIPDVLPQELVPPSSRDLNQSVDFLKDLLRNDTNARSTNLDPAQQLSTGGRAADTAANKYAKVRSFNAGASPEPTSSARREATGYKHDDGQVKSYKSNSRHLDRRNVRFQGEDDDDELAGLRRDLQSTQDLLDGSLKDEDEDEDLKAEIDDLKYRIRRVKDDIEYNKTGRRTEAKDEERRRLERELLFLMHDKLPELEEKMRHRDRAKRSSDRAAARKRDSRNNSSERYRNGNSGRTDDPDSDSEPEREKEAGYMRGSYGRDSGPSSKAKTSNRNDATSPDRSKGRSADSPAPVPPAPVVQQLEDKVAPPPPIPPVSTVNALPKKPQTAEERQAFIRAEAQRRVQERMRVLTGQSPSASPPPEARASSVDSTVQERIEQDKREAAERASNEDKAVRERERQRQLKLEEEKLGNLKREEGRLAETGKALQKVAGEVTAAEMKSAGGDRVAADAARSELEAEEQALGQRKSALQEERRRRAEHVRQLEEEADASKPVEVAPVPSKKKAPPPAPASRSAKIAPPKPPPSRVAQASAMPQTPVAVEAQSAPQFVRSPSPPTTVAAPAAPTPPPAPAAAPAPKPPGASNNPFHRMTGQAGVQSPATVPSQPVAAVKGTNNPFFRPPTGASAAPAVAQPVPVRPPPPRTQPSDDWGDARESSDADSDSDDEDAGAKGQSVQQKRAGLAGLLFGGPSSAPSSRPGSTKPDEGANGSAPAPPKAPAASLLKLGAAAGDPPPRSALLGAIQGGARLRKAVTNDRSLASGAGSVIGDASPPVQKYEPPSPKEEPRAVEDTIPAEQKGNNRQSVDWYGGLAADTYPSPVVASATTLATMQEEEEEDKEQSEAVAAPPSAQKPSLTLDDASMPTAEADSPEADFDMSTSTRVRTLYPYEAQREQDASFQENLLVIAHPPKDSSSDWLFGIVPATGSRGWLPKAYVEELRQWPAYELELELKLKVPLAFNTPAKVLYDYQGQTEEELSVQEGATLFIGDKIDADWARAILNGKVGLVPLAYLEENFSEKANDPVAVVDQHSTSLTASETDLQQAPSNQALSPELSIESDSESEDDTETAQNTQQSAAAREQERLRVMQAAGLIVQQADTAAIRRRRPPPPRPRPVSLGSDAGARPAPSPALSSVSFATAAEDVTEPSERETATDYTTQDAYAQWEQLQRAAGAGRAPNTDQQHLHAALTSLNLSDMRKTWSSLVESGTLESIPEQERKRQEAIFELIKTESSYLETLQLVVQEYYSKAQTAVDDKTVQVIFANVEDILLWSVTFLSDLEERQRSCRLYIDRIGGIVKKHAPGLDVYRPYCLNQTNASKTLLHARQESAAAGEVLGARVNGLALEHFLLEPMQRLARYPLLLQQILKYTDGDSIEHNDLSDALTTAQSVLNSTNEGIRDQENEATLQYLSDNLVFTDDTSIRLDLTAATRNMGKRKLLMEGMLIKGYHHRRQSKRKELQTYLFNDLLLFTTKSLGLKERLSVATQQPQHPDSITVYRAPLPLEELSIKPAREDQILVISHRGEEYKLQASTSRQRQQWVQQIEKARQAVLERKEKR